jgi:hypothetical protein
MLATMASGIAPGVRASPVTDLPGRWSGWGAVVLANGASEQVRCVATYFVNGGGSSLLQNLRCASASYKIDATANLTVSNGQVSGAWEEKTWSAMGSVAGRMTGDGFNLSIQGDTFSAAMALTTSSCKQSINIMPRGFDVSKISIGLGKC